MVVRDLETNSKVMKRPESLEPTIKVIGSDYIQLHWMVF